MYCPFIKDDCLEKCVFSESNRNDSCELLTTLKNIESNTSCDPTYSSSINDKLSDISDKLDDIYEKLEHSVD